MNKIHRRDFLSYSATAALVAGSASSLRSDPLGLPIGIQLYTVGSDMDKDAAAALAKIAQIGYREVETAGFGSAKDAPSLRKLIDATGLKCPSAHLTFDLKNLNASFDQAHALGCRYVVSSVPHMMIMDISTAGGNREKILSMIGAPFTRDELSRLIEAMNKVGTAAKQQGLVFTSHNHTFEFQTLDGGLAIDRMMKETAATGVQFELDCGWTSVAGYNPVEIVAKYPGRIPMLHIKDFLQFEKGAVLGGPNTKGAEIGEGKVDYEAIFAGMRGKGIEHAFVEQEGPFSRMPAMQAAEVDYKYLRRLG